MVLFFTANSESVNRYIWYRSSSIDLDQDFSGHVQYPAHQKVSYDSIYVCHMAGCRCAPSQSDTEGGVGLLQSVATIFYKNTKEA